MTDAEIIKALQCCSLEIYDCDNCPLNKTEESLCFIEIRKYALDLIKRKDSEIYELREKLNATIAGQETLQEYIAQRSPLGMAGVTE